MDLYKIIDQVVALLQKHGRVTYRALKLQFQLDDEHLEALKEELIEARELALDKESKVLVWVGEGAASVSRSTFQVSSPQSQTPNLQPPITYTPPHLAERIRTEQTALEVRSGTDGE